MEETYNLKAIILTRKSFREDDCLVTLYSQEKGRINLIARGAKKIKSKLAGHIELFNLINVMAIKGKHYDYAGSAISENCFGNIKNDLEKVSAAGAVIKEILKIVKENEPQKNIFDLLKDFLETLDHEKDLNFNHGLLVSLFALKFLTELGYQPELYHCVLCGNKITPAGNKFSSQKGGLVCKNCQMDDKDVLSISEEEIKILRFALENSFKKIMRLKIDDELEGKIIKIVRLFKEYQD
jgi:DNA repair protein RecO (recombination protein O)